MNRQQIINELTAKALDLYGYDLSCVEWILDWKCVSSFGTAIRRKDKYTVKMNKVLNHDMKMFYNTAAHEVAHIVDYMERTTSDHGPIWKKKYIALGGNPELTYDKSILDKLESKYKMFEYVTTKGSIKITSIRHNKIQRGTAYEWKGATLDKNCKWKEVIAI